MKPIYTNFTTPTVETIAVALIQLGFQARFLLKKTVLNKTRRRKLINPENYEVELIQVAAVAIAALTDYRMQHSDRQKTVIEEHIIKAVLAERARQDKKFNHQFPIKLDPLIWVAVLLEEISEVAAEVDLDNE